MTIIGINSLNDAQSFAEAEKFVTSLLNQNQYTQNNSMHGDSMSRPGGFRSYITHLEALTEQLGNAKGINFINSQISLHLLNPVFGQGIIWNPIAMLGPPPNLAGEMANSIDVGFASNNPGTRIAREEDKLVKMYEGQSINFKDFFNPQLYLADGTTLADKQVELNIANENKTFQNNTLIDLENPYSNRNIKTEHNLVAGVPVRSPNFETLFNKIKTGPVFGSEPGGNDFYAPRPSSFRRVSQAYSKKERSMQNHDVYFSKLDYETGYIDATIEKIADADTYIPFYFEDTRNPGKRIYFRAFLTSLNQTITPEWNQEKFYGRVDPVGTYMNTTRVVSVAFKIAAFSQAGLSTMWKKIYNFMKMLYPSFKNNALHAGPIVRMKIGDLISDGAGRGLTGWITNATFDYSQSTWETAPLSANGVSEIGMVPMFCDLSLTFQVIHEITPRLNESNDFEVIRFSPIGGPASESPRGVPTGNEDTSIINQGNDGIVPGRDRGLGNA